MTNKLVIYLALVSFSTALGLGMSTPAKADSACNQLCRGDRTECRQDCAFPDGNPSSACLSNCDAIYNSCMASCG
jgi:hypothetical protein